MKYIKGLRVDVECGEGEVKLPPEFYNESSLWRLDVLGDWIAELQKEKDKAHKAWMEHLRSVEPEQN